MDPVQGASKYTLNPNSLLSPGETTTFSSRKTHASLNIVENTISDFIKQDFGIAEGLTRDRARFRRRLKTYEAREGLEHYVIGTNVSFPNYSIFHIQEATIATKYVQCYYYGKK